MQNSVSELQNIHDIVVRFPGRTPLVLSCRTVDGIRLEISAGPRFNVEPDDALIEALIEQGATDLTCVANNAGTGRVGLTVIW